MIISKYVIKNVQQIILEEWSNSAWNVVDEGKTMISNLNSFPRELIFCTFPPSVVFQIIVLAVLFWSIVKEVFYCTVKDV